MIRVEPEKDLNARCSSCYSHEKIFRITVGLDGSGASNQSILALCPNCINKVFEKVQEL